MYVIEKVDAVAHLEDLAAPKKVRLKCPRVRLNLRANVDTRSGRIKVCLHILYNTARYLTLSISRIFDAVLMLN